ncbi:MAG TPA: glycosyltransferase [Devosia sp.]|jgi:amylovoran biosynthesis glycosyltransferase AmsE|uniref:glycosyltransferase n=1 Tax=Devosia sp. TaxID=1871048 RepID=UPI002F959846
MERVLQPTAKIFQLTRAARTPLPRSFDRTIDHDLRSTKLSVLMAVYGAEKPAFLKVCLQSLAAQTRPADEVVLVEDGVLEPELHSVIDRFRHVLPIVPVVLAENVGLAAALNAGLALCSGDVIARMDSDDVAHPRRFEKQLDLLWAQPELDIVGTFACEIDENSRIGRLWRRPVHHEGIIASLWANPMIHPSIMMRSATLQRLGGYDPALRRSEDHDLWFRAANQQAQFGNIAEPLLFYRFSPRSHARHTLDAALERARVAAGGAKSLGMPAVMQLACWLPVLRSLLPLQMRHTAYRLMQMLDPRLRRSRTNL